MAAKAARAVFEGGLFYGDSWIRNQRLILSMQCDKAAQGGKAQTNPSLGLHDAYIASMERVTQMIEEDVFIPMPDLSKLIGACNQKLANSMGCALSKIKNYVIRLPFLSVKITDKIIMKSISVHIPVMKIPMIVHVKISMKMVDTKTTDKKANKSQSSL